MFGTREWLAVGFLGIFGGAVTFLLWSFALEKTTPTLVGISITVNPIAAGLFGALALGEPVSASLVAGLVTVAAGILLAVSAPTEA